MRAAAPYLCAIAIAWSSTACVVTNEDVNAGNTPGEITATTDEHDVSASDLLAEPAGGASTLSARYCDEDFDCQSACACIGGTCQPDGFGPPPPAGYCEQPPQRACTSSSNCRSGCVCSGGTCQPWGGGPPPPEADYCAQPPPDVYEDDDYYTAASHYSGSPQTGHNFHERGDVDWILVYFGYAMAATFETYNLSGTASDTYLRVYVYNHTTGQLGSLVAANDNVCGYYWLSHCKASRAVVNVPANSVYAIKVTNNGDAGRTVYDQYAPSYDFRIY